MKLIYVIVVTFNGIKWVDACFGSLRNSGYPVKVVAIDNGSTDGSQQAIRSKFPEVEFIQSPSNIGFGKANNVGIRYAIEANADFVFLLNQDAWIEPTTIETLINVSGANANYGILSPIHLQANREHLDRQFSTYISPARCPGFVDDIVMKRSREVYSCQFVNAAAWLMTRKCLLSVGLFEPMFQLYGEDDNYLQRLKYHRHDIGIVPAASIVHDRSDRQGKKNKLGQILEIQTYILIRMLNVNGSLSKNVVRSFNVFLRYGLNPKTIRPFLSVIINLFSINRRLGEYKKQGYMIK